MPQKHVQTSSVVTAFEEWAVEEGWAQLVLPTKEEAAEYFARFRTPASLNPDRMIVEEEVVQGMVDELHIVMKSVRFSAATIVSATAPCISQGHRSLLQSLASRR